MPTLRGSGQSDYKQLALSTPGFVSETSIKYLIGLKSTDRHGIFMDSKTFSQGKSSTLQLTPNARTK